MNYRKFGNTELRVSEIGFGAWAIGGEARVGEVEIGWGPADDDVSKQALHAALDAGVNFFDTADFYGLGHSEELLGKFLKDEKDALIATKVGQHVGADGNIAVSYDYDYVMEACEKSLRRLKRDHIDVYQLHIAKLPQLQKGDCINAMHQLVKQGKIRYWGISLVTFAPGPEAKFLLETKEAHSYQLVLNLINQRAIPLLDEIKNSGAGVIARMPLQFGLLTGNIQPGKTFSSGDHRSKRVTPSIIQQVTQVLRTDIVPMAKQYNTTVAGLALSYVLSYDAVSTVIPGLRTAAQVKQNTTGIVQLSDYDKQYLSELFSEEKSGLMKLIEAAG